jgi:hypothetical protein
VKIVPPAQDPPEGLAVSGRRLWASLTTEYELDVHEQLLLTQACRTIDLLDSLAEDLRTAPRTMTNARGDLISHPSLNEHRQQSLTLARLLASLRLPQGDEDDVARPQRRGVRVAYVKHLREQQQGRPWEWGAAARRIADLESGRPVAVRYWELRKFAPHMRLPSDAWVQLRGDELVPVSPVMAADGLRIVGFLADDPGSLDEVVAG